MYPKACAECGLGVWYACGTAYGILWTNEDVIRLAGKFTGPWQRDGPSLAHCPKCARDGRRGFPSVIVSLDEAFSSGLTGDNYSPMGGF